MDSMNFWQFLDKNVFGLRFLLLCFMIISMATFGMYLEYKTDNK